MIAVGHCTCRHVSYLNSLCRICMRSRTRALALHISPPAARGCLSQEDLKKQHFALLCRNSRWLLLYSSIPPSGIVVLLNFQTLTHSIMEILCLIISCTMYMHMIMITLEQNIYKFVWKVHLYIHWAFFQTYMYVLHAIHKQDIHLSTWSPIVR